jgi:hypothetical protein
MMMMMVLSLVGEVILMGLVEIVGTLLILLLGLLYLPMVMMRLLLTGFVHRVFVHP